MSEDRKPSYLEHRSNTLEKAPSSAKVSGVFFIGEFQSRVEWTVE